MFLRLSLFAVCLLCSLPRCLSLAVPGGAIYVPLTQGTVVNVVKSSGEVRKAWKKRRRRQSPLLVPANLIDLPVEETMWSLLLGAINEATGEESRVSVAAVYNKFGEMYGTDASRLMELHKTTLSYLLDSHSDSGICLEGDYIKLQQPSVSRGGRFSKSRGSPFLIETTEDFQHTGCVKGADGKVRSLGVCVRLR